MSEDNTPEGKIVPILTDPNADIEAAANSIAAMVIEWIDEGQRMEISDWRPGLPGIIKSRLKRFWP